MENKVELTSGVDAKLKRKLSLVAELCFEDGNDAAGVFINRFLEDFFNIEMAEYLYTSDICSWMNDTILDICIKLLMAKANPGWYMLLQSVSDEVEDLAEVGRNIMYAFNHGVTLEDVQELFAHFSSADEFQNEISNLLNEQETGLQSDEEQGENNDRYIILQELRKLNENISLQLEPLHILTELQQQLGKLDEIRLLSDRLRKAELTIRLLMKEKENLQSYLEHNNNSREIAELSNEIACLKEREQSLQEQLEEADATKTSLTNEKKQLELCLNELRNDNMELKMQLADKRPAQNLKPQNLRMQVQQEEVMNSVPEQKRVFPSEATAEHIVLGEESEVFNEIDFLRELGCNPDDITDIVPDKVGLIERIINFARIHSRYYEREYQKRPLSEQENLIFVKMMELHFSKEKVLLVKNILQTQKLSRVEIYKFLTKNPSEDELTKFFENAA